MGLISTLPKLAPLPVDEHDPLFIGFTSNYGIEVPDNVPAASGSAPNWPASTNGCRKSLWFSALDVDRLPNDPSSAPVC